MASFIDGCIRHKITADSCPLKNIVVSHQDLPRQSLLAVDGVIPHVRKKLKDPNNTILVLHDWWNEKTIEKVNEKFEGSSFDERYRAYTQKMAVHEQERKRAGFKTDLEKINQIGSLLFPNNSNFDAEFAEETRKLFDKFRAKS